MPSPIERARVRRLLQLAKDHIQVIVQLAVVHHGHLAFHFGRRFFAELDVLLRRKQIPARLQLLQLRQRRPAQRKITKQALAHNFRVLQISDLTLHTDAIITVC